MRTIDACPQDNYETQYPSVAAVSSSPTAALFFPFLVKSFTFYTSTHMCMGLPQLWDYLTGIQGTSTSQLQDLVRTIICIEDNVAAAAAMTAHVLKVKVKYLRGAFRRSRSLK